MARSESIWWVVGLGALTGLAAFRSRNGASRPAHAPEQRPPLPAAAPEAGAPSAGPAPETAFCAQVALDQVAPAAGAPLAVGLALFRSPVAFGVYISPSAVDVLRSGSYSPQTESAQLEGILQTLQGLLSALRLAPGTGLCVLQSISGMDAAFEVRGGRVGAAQGLSTFPGARELADACVRCTISAPVMSASEARDKVQAAMEFLASGGAESFGRSGSDANAKITACLLALMTPAS